MAKIKDDVIKGQLERQQAREEAFEKKRRDFEESMRASGRTTRLIDKYIQEFFEKGQVTLKDHHESGRDARANQYLTNKFKVRMNTEHQGIKIKYTRKDGVDTATIIKE